jgi:hypothetical protein
MFLHVLSAPFLINKRESERKTERERWRDESE